METVLIFFEIIFMLISILICSIPIYRANLHKDKYGVLPSRTSASLSGIPVVIAGFSSMPNAKRNTQKSIIQILNIQ